MTDQSKTVAMSPYGKKPENGQAFFPQFEDEAVMRALHRERIRGDWMDLFYDPIPAELMTDYPLDAEGLERNAQIMKKYTRRPQNIRRAWNRTQRYLPELMQADGPSYDVLELSTAHGAMLEVARHFGHRVTGNDYANMVYPKQGQKVATMRPLNDETFTREVDDFGVPIKDGYLDWPYRYITDSVDIPMSVFDCGNTPYPFDDKSFDYTLCFQAIEHYCHPDHWMEVIDEMCRITRRSIFLLLNPMHTRFYDVEGYRDSYDAFRLAMRSYNRNGFENVAVHMHWGHPVGFKLIHTGG